MNSFETLVSRYNAALPTFSDGCGGELQLTSRGVLYVTPADLDGTSIIFQDGDDVSGNGDRGFIVYGVDSTNIVHPLALDNEGQVIATIDPSPGIDFDEGTDESGNGEFGSVTQSYQTIISVALTSGSSYAISAFDGSADSLTQFQLAVNDGSSRTYIRNLMVTENMGTNQLVFPRPREVTALNTTTTVELRAKALRDCVSGATVAGGINIYEQTF